MHVHACVIGMCTYGGETDPIRGLRIAGFNEIVGGDSLTSLSRLVGNIKICRNPGLGGGGGAGWMTAVGGERSEEHGINVQAKRRLQDDLVSQG